MSIPAPRLGRALATETVEKVKQFYCDDGISRELPGLNILFFFN